MWAFLQLFYSRFDQYSGELHVAGESYGGTYIPHIASAIHQNNKALGAQDDLVYVNLTSILLGNGASCLDLEDPATEAAFYAGLTDPYTQFGAFNEWLCDGKWKVFEEGSPECTELGSVMQTCQRLIQVRIDCYCANPLSLC